MQQSSSKTIRDFRAALRLLEREVQRSVSGQADCCGVSTAQCHVLLELEGSGSVSLTGLASRMELDKSTLSRTVDSLVLSGWVSRTTDPDSRRQQVICLSESGKEKVAQINGLCDAYYQSMFEPMTQENQSRMVKAAVELAESLLALRKEKSHDVCSC